ncbi:MAG: hypothetical protein ACXACU_10000 [Candidatus Hodarchaeales archaeon]|jgi:hypothetical protein
MFVNYRKTKPPTKRQVTIWNMKRNKLKGGEIAKQIKVDPAFVSRSLKETNKRIERLLKDAGKMNKIKLNLTNGELGFARGHSYIFNVPAFITFSPINGLQVWYEHKGECTNCEEFAECRTVLLQEFKERNIQVPEPSLRPTDLSDLLLKKIEERLV